MIEPLESRVAPAGVVNVTFKSGLLSIVGDSAANKITLASTANPGEFTLVGDDGETFNLNGAPAGVVLVSGLTGAVKVNLGAGSDRFALSNSVLPAGLDLQLGAGNDDTVISSSTVAGALKIQGADGENTVTVDGSSFRVGGAMEVVGGTGKSSVSFDVTSADIGGALKLSGGKLGGVFGSVPPTRLAVGGDLSIKQTSAGGGSVFSGTLTVGGNLNVDVPALAAGATNVTQFLGTAVTIGGKLKAKVAAASSALEFTPNSIFRAYGGLDATLAKNTSLTVRSTDVLLGPVKVTAPEDTSVDLNASGALDIYGSVKVAGNTTFRLFGSGTVYGPVDVTARFAEINNENSPTKLRFLGPATFNLKTVGGTNTSLLAYKSDFVGALTVKGGGAKVETSVSLQDVFVGGATSLKLGTGSTALSLLTVRIDTDTVSGAVTLAGTSTFAGPVSIELGKADDNLNLSGNQAGAIAKFLSTVKIKKGGGNDTITTTGSSFPAGQPVIV